ncbi:hypothetical protein K7432_003694 [Basidiobolus ranarum]|uniref:Uncharacterized protein n=1 Tax=Basidiobolus ranarum TaxID=34480 RepID=A0ABR2W6M3_9FUNG
MSQQPTSSNSQDSLSFSLNNALKALTCASCNGPFNQPVTLSCGNTLCLTCLPEIIDDTCNAPCCMAKHYSTTETHVDVTLAKLTKICLDEIESNKIIPEECEQSTSNKNMETYTEDISKRVLGNSEIHRTALKDVLSLEFECQICYQIFHDPVTTECGHTFCYSCLLRTCDHRDSCPMCRHRLIYNKVSQSVINNSLNRLVSLCLPEVVLERKLQVDQELANENNDIPLFVCSLVFPGMPCQLHVFEPRYRLMIRRSMETKARQFGMLLPGKHGQPFVEYGTMVRIKSVDSLPDGRSLVKTVGMYRFRVKEHSNKDGYLVGRIERIVDEPTTENITLRLQPVNPDIVTSTTELVAEDSAISLEEMMITVKQFINSLRDGSAPWLLQRLDTTYGSMPNQPEEFSFWAASVIPIGEYEKYKLLTTRSTKLRLRMIVHWTESFKEQWWFARGGCVTT